MTKPILWNKNSVLFLQVNLRIIKNNSEEYNSGFEINFWFLLEIGKILSHVPLKELSPLWSSLDVSSSFMFCWYSSHPTPGWDDVFTFFNQAFSQNYSEILVSASAIAQRLCCKSTDF